MAFKYEIWKYVVNPINPDVFLINNYEKFADVTPNDNRFSLVVEKADNQEYYRVQPSGELRFYKDDFDTIKTVYADCDPYILMVFDDSDVSRSSFIKSLFFNQADFIGFLRPRTMTMDYDRCVATVNPDVLDCYTKFLRGLSDSVNVFDITERRFVSGLYPENNVEWFNNEYETTIVPDPEINDLPYSFGVRVSLTFSLTDDVYSIKDVYAREYTWIASGNVPPQPNAGWVVDTFNSTTNLFKWIRPLLNIQTPLYTQNDNRYDLIIDPALVKGGKYRGLVLNDVIKELRIRTEIETFAPPVATNSLFLFSNINPLTGVQSKFDTLILMQQSDAKLTSDKATKLELSMEDIFNILSYLNLKWHIEWGYGDIKILIIEHMSFYEKGLTYSTSTKRPYLYTVADNDIRKIIKYSDSEPPSKDVFTLGYSLGEDFIGKPIEYAKGCASDTVNEINFAPLTTDVEAMRRENPDDTPNEGVILLQTEESSYSYLVNGVGVTGRGYKVRSEEGLLSGNILLNAGLSTANVQDFLWRDNASTETGTLNGSEVTFNSVKRNKFIDNVPIKIKYKQMNPFLLVDSVVGEGKITQATFNNRTCIWDSTLSFSEINL